MVAMKLVVVLVALATSAYGKPWGLDINPVASISGAVKGAADAANNGIKAAASAAGVDKQLEAVSNVADSVTKPLSDVAASASVNIPGMDSLPSMDSLPKIPGMDSLPNMDSLPKIPGMDSLPSMDSLPKIPGMDSLPSMDSLPKIPGLDSLPKIPGMDSLSKIPGLDKLPSLSSWNPMNKLTSLNPMNALSGLASWNPISSMGSMLSPWNIFVRVITLRYPALTNAISQVKDNLEWLIGQLNTLFKQAFETGKLNFQQALDVIYAAAASAAKHSSNPLKYVIVGLNQAIKNGDIDSTTAVKVLVKAIQAGVHNQTFTDASEPLAYATKLALEDGIISEEVAEKLRNIAQNASTDELKEEANKEEKENKENADVNVNINTDADKKDEAAADVNVNVNVNTDN